MPFIKNRDSRLVKAYELIEAGSISTLSLDLFDTVVWRKVPTPKDLFLLLGKRLKEGGWLIPAVTKESFFEMRIKAEKEARLEKEFFFGHTEVILSEIYWKLKGIFNPLNVQQILSGDGKGIYASEVTDLVNQEVALEQELIQLDANISHLIFFAKQKKIPVILVSDTYFEEPHLHHLLNHRYLFDTEPLLSAIDQIFLSCEHGCSKQDGLFQKVLQKLNINPQSILHIGDHNKSDVQSASHAGMKTIYYQKYSKNLEEILEREWTSDPSKRQQLLDEHQGDFGLSSLRAKITQDLQLHQVARQYHVFWKYGAEILGPILFGFVHWIYDRCHEMQESKVFCLMREGKLYAELIERFAPYYPQHKIEAKKLWVSRDFITHAALAQASIPELHRTMNALLEKFTVEHFCTYLGLDIQDIKKWIKYRHVMLGDATLRKEFILALLSQEQVCRQIIQNASAKRQRFLKYLSSLIDLSNTSQMTLVDIGWSGTIQNAIQRILQLDNATPLLHGLYLCTTGATHSSLMSGHTQEGYLIKGGHPYDNVHYKGCFVLEQTATAETGVGSLQDIDELGKIITAPFRIPIKQKKQAEMVQKGIFAFFDQMGPYMQSGAITWKSESASLQNQLRQLLLRSMMYTTKNEAHLFGPWFHDFAPRANLTQVIGDNSYFEQFIKDMLPEAAFQENDLHWPSAYAAKNSKYLTRASQAVWLDQVPSRCFLSEDTFLLKIFLDTGKGFTEKPIETIDLRSNPNRNFYTLHKLFSSKRSIKRLQLQLSFPFSLVRFNSLRIECYDREQLTPFNSIYFEKERPLEESLQCFTEKQINYNTFYCDESLSLIHSFKTSAIYQIKFMLCCEMFKWKKETLSPLY